MNQQTAGHSPLHETNEEFEKQQIRTFFGDRSGGFCVEVGAHEPLSFCSQSLHLEQQLNWNCLLIEPNPVLAGKARELRPASRVCEAACTSPEHVGVMQLHIPIDDTGREITGHAGLQKNADEHFYRRHKDVDVKADTLGNLLKQHGIAAVDLLSIDVEGAELEVLRGFDFKQYRPRLILLEDKHLYLQKHRLLARNGYKLVRRLNRNCWYIPRESAAPDVPWIDRLKLWKRMYVSIWFRKLQYAWRHKTLEPLRTL